MTKKPSRKELLKVMGASAVWTALLGVPGCKLEGSSSKDAPSTIKAGPVAGTTPMQSGDLLAFRSRPDLSPPAVEANTLADGTASGYLFVAPKVGVGQSGPMILDDSGHLVWFSDGWYARDFKMQQYQGKPVLTWWNGKVVLGHGEGEYVIFDDSYREITRVKPGNGYNGDLHEFNITARDTALLTAYDPVPMDLTPVGGRKDGAVWDGIAQELDIETGEVLFEWHSLDHVDIEASYHRLPDDRDNPFDFFHINSIDVDYDDNLIISSRNTFAVYKIDRESGEVMWRLGGKDSDFEMGEGTRTAWQHDARRQPDGTITIFDNGSYPTLHEQSRGIALELDMDRMSATLVREYTHPEKLVATSQGNVQMLPNGNALIGWGSEPYFSEFGHEGELLLDARFASDTNESYRAFRFEWSGYPSEKPAVVAETGPGDEVTVYVSWNGATEVVSWEVLAGSEPERLEPVGTVPCQGFETAISVRTAKPYVAVRARDDIGQMIGASEAVKPAS